MSEPRVIKKMAPTLLTTEVSLPVKSSLNNNKTAGQNRELDYLKKSKVLGPLLEDDKVIKDPLVKKKHKKKVIKEVIKKDKKEDCVKTYQGQSGRRYVLGPRNKKLYIENQSNRK